jgi:ornithine--oxo-acid transaminase
VLVEPIQGEAGVVIPPEGYLRGSARSATSATCCSSPTRSSRASRGSARRSRATARASCPTCTCSARRSAAASCPSRRSSRNRRARRHPPRRARIHLRGQPARRRVGLRVVEMLASGEFQTRALALGEHLEGALQARRPGRHHRAGRRTLGRRRHRPGLRNGPRDRRGSCSGACS